MSRQFLYEEKEICDVCGEKGAFDIYGDYICGNCLHPSRDKRMSKEDYKKAKKQFEDRHGNYKEVSKQT